MLWAGLAGVLPVVSEQDVQSSQRAELQRSLVLAEEGSEDGNGVGQNRPQVDFQRRAGDQCERCHRDDVRTGTLIQNNKPSREELFSF